MGLTDVNDSLARSRVTPDFQMLFLHVLESSFMKHDANYALQSKSILR